ncbi:hypothetical protein IMSHALPRED_004594 [Imshaugia aleurites]|uniref:Uncharacterized protein n=1 Tax=Imshaugia aleurites TaxID=172621 RepID=A0A8H3IMQ0_9LECA|nr:hypothetical protein IMSHALPRED_004594 [Imshaugia aleurites]
MGPGDVKLGVECQDEAEEGLVEPKPQRGSHEGSEAEGEEAPRDNGAGNKSGRKRRSRTKRRATPSSHDLAPQRTDGPESAPRKIQKTWQGQSLSVSSSKIRGEIAVQGSGSSELTEVDNFLSDLSEELDAKAARKIRFSAYL